jgi:hypothetical protein
LSDIDAFLGRIFPVTRIRFCRCVDHKTLRATPGMATKATKHRWEIGDIVNALESWEAARWGLSENSTKFTGSL